MIEFTLRDRLILSLFAKAVEVGEIFIPRTPAKAAKGLRAQCYAVAKKARTARHESAETESFARLFDDASLYVEEHPIKGWGVWFRRKDLDPLNQALEQALNDLGAGKVTPRTEADELSQMAERIRQSAQPDIPQAPRNPYFNPEDR